ncbi:MAG: serine protease [Geminicoccaceae bacterium]
MEGDRAGSGFIYDHKGHQYIITARHVVDGMSHHDHLYIGYGDSVAQADVRLVGYARDGSDVAVLTTNVVLNRIACPEAGSEGLVYSQQVHFLGFPYGMRMMPVGDVTGNFPIPFVKSAVISAMGVKWKGNPVTFLDGINNPGFSGGPVVFDNISRDHKRSKGPKLLGIVSGYHVEPEPIHVRGTETQTDMIYRANTGLVIVYPIERALEIIESNPIGCAIA